MVDGNIRLAVINRQERILDPRMNDLTVLIAGAGMVGSWAALALVRAVGGGVHVWDNDTVEDVNVGVQAYDGTAVGMPKVDALARMGMEPPITPHNGLFPEFEAADLMLELVPENVVVLCAVDSMAGRRKIAEWSRDNGVGLFIETGVKAELVVVKTAVTPEDYERYLAGLPGDNEVEDAQCGLKGTAYAGMSLASQIVPLVNGWCKGDRLPRMRLFHTGYFMPIEGRDDEEGGEPEQQPTQEQPTEGQQQ